MRTPRLLAGSSQCGGREREHSLFLLVFVSEFSIGGSSMVFWSGFSMVIWSGSSMVICSGFSMVFGSGFSKVFWSGSSMVFWSGSSMVFGSGSWLSEERLEQEKKIISSA